jgi:hypothetical protein
MATKAKSSVAKDVAPAALISDQKRDRAYRQLVLEVTWD